MCTNLNELCTYYIALLGFSSEDAKKCESAVTEEFERQEIEANSDIPTKANPQKKEVSTSVKWLKARVGMLWAHTVKRAYMYLKILYRGRIGYIRA